MCENLAIDLHKYSNNYDEILVYLDDFLESFIFGNFNKICRTVLGKSS